MGLCVHGFEECNTEFVSVIEAVIYSGSFCCMANNVDGINSLDSVKTVTCGCIFEMPFFLSLLYISSGLCNSAFRNIDAAAAADGASAGASSNQIYIMTNIEKERKG